MPVRGEPTVPAPWAVSLTPVTVSLSPSGSVSIDRTPVAAVAVMVEPAMSEATSLLATGGRSMVTSDVVL